MIEKKLGSPEAVFPLKTLEDTEKLAQKVASCIKPGDILCLEGDLGAGKTTWSQFFCKALEVEEHVTSPTFNIMNTYEGVKEEKSIAIHHFDTYRIGEPEEMDEIGFEEILYSGGICLIEWASVIESLLPEEIIWMTLTFNEEYIREARFYRLPEHFRLLKE